MKGIILAGGSGSRLHPITLGVSKQLIPVFSKPMIYYPLSSLLLAGIREILIITTPNDASQFKRLLGDGSQWGISLSYEVQAEPNGLAQAFILGKNFLDGDKSCLVLGDNLFYGHNFQAHLLRGAELSDGALIYGYWVKDPERYGVAELGKDGRVLSLEEKPLKPKSNYAVTGLYFYDETVCERAARLRPSKRGELEITDLNKTYLDEGKLGIHLLERGIAWLDTGTHSSLLDAVNFVKAIEDRQGLLVCSPEEISWRMGFIDTPQLEKLGQALSKSEYGQYLLRLKDQDF